MFKVFTSASYFLNETFQNSVRNNLRGKTILFTENI